MAWETRPGTNNMYFTQSKRVDGRVIRQYLGNSPQARELARQCEEMRELRNAERIRQAKKMDRFAAAEAARAEGGPGGEVGRTAPDCNREPISHGAESPADALAPLARLPNRSGARRSRPEPAQRSSGIA